MKKVAIALSTLLAALLVFLAIGEKQNKRSKITPPPYPNLDEHMVGPRGEEIFIGAGGGRYFIKNGKKIYVGYKGRKQHVTD